VWEEDTLNTSPGKTGDLYLTEVVPLCSFPSLSKTAVHCTTVSFVQMNRKTGYLDFKSEMLQHFLQYL